MRNPETRLLSYLAEDEEIIGQSTDAEFRKTKEQDPFGLLALTTKHALVYAAYNSGNDFRIEVRNITTVTTENETLKIGYGEQGTLEYRTPNNTSANQMAKAIENAKTQIQAQQHTANVRISNKPIEP